MSIRRTRFMRPTNPGPPQQKGTLIVEPTGGLNAAQPIWDLRPGETPESQNFVVEDGFLTPRSGLSQYGDLSSVFSAGDVITGVHAASRAYQSGRYRMLMVDNRGTVGEIDLDDASDTWTKMSGPDAVSNFTNRPNYWQFTEVEAPETGIVSNPIVVFHRNDTYPMWTNQANSSFSTLQGFIDSNHSYAGYSVAFDERLIFWGVRPNDQGLKANRVKWSVRGSPTSFVGGGHQDLVDMSGVGTGIMELRDRLVLFSSQEVWEGRPRRDNFAFDFFALEDSVGCPHPQTLKQSDAGIVWLGPGYQVYLMDQTRAIPVGSKVQQYLRDTVKELETLWAEIREGPSGEQYWLFFSDTEGEYPSKALVLDTNSLFVGEPVWMLQDFGQEITFGARARGDELLPTIYQGYPNIYDLVLATSDTTALRLRSDQTNDDGTAIDARWRSHAIADDKDFTNYQAIQEAWLGVEQSSSTATVEFHVTVDGGNNFTDTGNVVLSNETPVQRLSVTPQAGRNPQFELRIADGSTPKIGRVQLTLRSYSGRNAG